MTKYSTGDDDGRLWVRDRRYVMHEWTSKPFVGHRHRHETVEHRIVIEYSHGVGADILHECRSDDTEKFPNEWKAVETLEIREYGVRHDCQPQTRWLK